MIVTLKIMKTLVSNQLTIFYINNIQQLHCFLMVYQVVSRLLFSLTGMVLLQVMYESKHRKQ